MLEEHLSGFDDLDEVWVPSGIVQDAVAKRSPIPVVRMPHAIRFCPSPHANRSQFGWPEDKFRFLLIFDFSSYLERKNPLDALPAFDEAFGERRREGNLGGQDSKCTIPPIPKRPFCASECWTAVT